MICAGIRHNSLFCLTRELKLYRGVQSTPRYGALCLTISVRLLAKKYSVVEFALGRGIVETSQFYSDFFEPLRDLFCHLLSFINSPTS